MYNYKMSEPAPASALAPTPLAPASAPAPQFTPASELKYDEEEMRKIMEDTENIQERLERTDRNPREIKKRNEILKREFTRLKSNASTIVAKYKKIRNDRFKSQNMTEKDIQFKIDYMKKRMDDIIKKTQEKGYNYLDDTFKRDEIDKTITKLKNEISKYEDILEAHLFGLQLDMAGSGKKKKSKKKTKKRYGGKKKKCGGKKKKCGGKTKKKCGGKTKKKRSKK